MSACWLLCAILTGCDQSGTSTSQPVAAASATKSIVSLSPAATDLLLAMGAGDRLVGVSTYDTDPRVGSLPKVGDYENVDWERIATLSPKFMIVQMAADRVPAGLRDRVHRLGISLYVAQIDRLADIPKQMLKIGEAIGSVQAGRAAALDVTRRIAAVAERTQNLPRVRTLIVTSEDLGGVAGRGTYLDDLVSVAGGDNVLDASRTGYVHLDREAIVALAPEAIIQLLPSPTAAQRERANRAMDQLAQTPALKNRRVLVIDEPWSLTPGAHVGELAERMAEFLHP